MAQIPRPFRVSCESSEKCGAIGVRLCRGPQIGAAPSFEQLGRSPCDFVYPQNCCRRAKIEGFNFCDFRHTAVTDMRRAGIDHLTIMKITGHKTMAAFKRYNSFRVNEFKKAASQLNPSLTLAHTPQVTHSPNSLIVKGCARSSVE